MKKLSLLTMILFMVLGGVNAQQKHLKVSQRIDANLPMVICAAIEAAYPGLKIQQPQLASAAVAKKEKDTDKVNTWSSKIYHVQHKGKNYKKRVIYNEEGELLYSKEVHYNRALPVAMYKQIGKKYNGWLIKKTMAITEIDATDTAPQHTMYYKVLFQKGNKRQWERLNEAGELYAQKRF